MIFTETLVIDDVIATSPAKAARQTWFRDYLAQEGTYHAYASFAADAVQLIIEAINRFDSADRESVRAAIEATQTEGLTGPLRMTAENHSGLMPQALTTVVAQGGRWRPAN
jgi:branched-chain amino acid transport system substrate-binding protein